MRYIEWAVMFLVAGIGIALANFVGFQVNFMDCLLYTSPSPRD